MSPKALILSCLFAGSLVGATQAQATTGLHSGGVGFNQSSGGSFSAFGKTVIGHTAFGGPSVYSPFGSLNSIGGYGNHGPTFGSGPKHSSSSGWNGKPISVEKTKHGKTFHFGSFTWDKHGQGHSTSHGGSGHSGGPGHGWEPDYGHGGHGGHGGHPGHYHGDGCDDDGNEGGEGGGTPAVPEPASWALMMVGFGVVGSSMRRRHANLDAVQFS